jgi:hypothetical protein
MLMLQLTVKSHLCVAVETQKRNDNFVLKWHIGGVLLKEYY